MSTMTQSNGERKATAHQPALRMVLESLPEVVRLRIRRKADHPRWACRRKNGGLPARDCCLDVGDQPTQNALLVLNPAAAEMIGDFVQKGPKFVVELFVFLVWNCP